MQAMKSMDAKNDASHEQSYLSYHIKIFDYPPSFFWQKLPKRACQNASFTESQWFCRSSDHIIVSILLWIIQHNKSSLFFSFDHSSHCLSCRKGMNHSPIHSNSPIKKIVVLCWTEMHPDSPKDTRKIYPTT